MINNKITGLTGEEVSRARAEGKVNVQIDKTAKSVGDIVRENIFTYFNLIFLVLTILVCVSGTFRSLTFLPVVIVNIFIGIIQELRAKKVLDNLSVMSQPKIKCIRDGGITEVSTQELVLGDVIILASGDQIPADAEVVEGSVNVNEALLTGEADEIEKNPGTELMSGSFVVSGECKAKLTRVGADSYISRLTLEAKNMGGGEQSEMVRSINRFVIAAGIMIIPIGAILFVQGMMNEKGFSGSVTS
ncbi:MAG: HAD-IC family P-type ATPase, partial [Lachnospiraceae bacterium]|nr:HAD-IC family P-type ATPase [Lachnospiraceae bacterium]